jgi:hypothetical protein
MINGIIFWGAMVEKTILELHIEYILQQLNIT